MYLSSHWPPYPFAIFFDPPPQIQISFVDLMSLFLLISPWSGAQNIYSPLQPSYTPHRLPICNHMIFDGADRERGRRLEMREKGGAGVGRGMKNVKIWKGGERGKICACRSEKGEGRQGAGGVRPTLLSTL